MEMKILFWEVAVSMIMNWAGMASAENVVKKLLARRIGTRFFLCPIILAYLIACLFF
jgi:hypothetical protein